MLPMHLSGLVLLLVLELILHLNVSAEISTCERDHIY